MACALAAEAGVLLLLGEQVRFPRYVVGAPFGLRLNAPHARYRHRSADVNVAIRISGQGMRAAGIDVEVLKSGVSGYGNAEECLYLERELLRYEPDLVLGSFAMYDLLENVRTNLFALEDGRLVERASSYVPMRGLADFLNTNPFTRFLSERSNAFALLKDASRG